LDKFDYLIHIKTGGEYKNYMNICNTCGMKFIRNDFYERHLATHTEKVEAPVEEAKPEEPKEPAVEEKVTDEVILKFSKPVEIYINGKAYLGSEVVAPNMTIASEIVRIAREAYGREILL
jgi:hypothetical protein